MLFVFDTGANFSSEAKSVLCYINGTTRKAQATSGTGFTETKLSGSAAGVQQCALYSVISNLTTEQLQNLRNGIMGFNVSGKAMKSYNPASNTWSECTKGDGGCLLIPLSDISVSTTRNNLLDWLEKINSSGNNNYEIKGNIAGDTGAIMQESWAYLFGKQGLSGTNYTAPTTSGDSCKANKYTIYIANSFNNASGAKDQGDSPEKTLKGTSTATAQNASPASLASNWTAASGTDSNKCGNFTFDRNANNFKSGIYAAHWAGYLKTQEVVSYGIGVVNPGACKPDYPAILKLLARKGGGKYFDASNMAEMSTVLTTILDEILAVNTVFASASLPVSVNTQGTYLNQIFVGMFRPQADKNPRWMGNLKQYKFSFNSTGDDLMLVGADNKQAIGSKGFIGNCARRFWGQDSKTTNDY